MKNSLIVAILLVSGITSGCVSLSPPPRPEYTGSDTIANAQPAQLIGLWTVTNLNPYPDTEASSTVIEYRADGTVTGIVDTSGEGMEAFKDVQVELIGQWALDGDILSHQNIKMISKNDSAMGSMLARIMNNRSALPGVANIYELTSSRMVMVGKDGTAMEYVRQ